MIFQSPWLAAIFIKNVTNGEYTHHCGGSIISEMHILTAAHCLDPRINPTTLSDNDSVKSNIKIIVGMEKPGENCTRKKEVEYGIKDFFIHPEFNFPYYDVAILELESKIKFTKGISSVCLSRDSTDNLRGRAVSLSGWGAVSPNHPPSKFLRTTNQLDVTTVSYCKNKIGIFTYGDPVQASVFNRKEWLKIDDSDGELSMEGLICVEDQTPNGLTGSCEGDSGSPVVKRAFVSHGGRRYEQVGIVSGGRCSDRDTPSVLNHIGHEKVWEFIQSKSKFKIFLGFEKFYSIIS